jgi:predicted RNase H-like HicB family nuclease
VSARIDTVAAMTNTFTAIFEEAEEGGYIAYVAELPGANTQGETLDEARENLREAVEMVLEGNREIALKKASRSRFTCEELVIKR